MKKFYARNKKLASALVIFALVFMMAGAFALFQTTLDVRGRVNMYIPTVDAIIADLTPVAVPFYELADVVHGGAVTHRLLGPADTFNPSVSGPFSAGSRFDNRVFLPTAWDEGNDEGSLGGVGSWLEVDSGIAPPHRTTAFVPAALIALNENQTIYQGFVSAAPEVVQFAQRIAWWAWAHQGSGVDTAIAGSNFARPTADNVRLGNIITPTNFETLYLNLTFDAFEQFYIFDLELANIGVIPLQIYEVDVVRLGGMSSELPWEVPGAELPVPAAPEVEIFVDALQRLHPAFEDSTTDDYVLDGLLGFVNITVDMEDAWDTTAAGGTGAAIIPPVTGVLGANTVDIGLRFCVNFDNWNWFLRGVDVWGGEAIGADPADWADMSEDEQIAAVTAFTFNNALSGLFRITYTVVPYTDVNVVRPPAGVIGW